MYSICNVTFVQLLTENTCTVWLMIKLLRQNWQYFKLAKRVSLFKQNIAQSLCRLSWGKDFFWRCFMVCIMAFNSSPRVMYSTHNILLLVGFCSAKCWQEQVLNRQERGSYDTHWCYDSLLAAMRVRCFFLLRWPSKYMQNLLKVCCMWHVVYKIADHIIYRNY